MHASITAAIFDIVKCLPRLKSKQQFLGKPLQQNKTCKKVYCAYLDKCNACHQNDKREPLINAKSFTQH